MGATTTWDLWTTTAGVVLDHRDRRHLDAAVACVQEVTAAVDDACSRFRPDSELVARREELVRGAPVSPMLARLVGHALEAAAMSGGDVDPTLGRRMRTLGYDAAVAAADPVPVAANLLDDCDDCEDRDDRDDRPAWQRIMLTGSFLRIPAGVELDLGASAKAVAADLAAATITARLGIGALVSLGGDIATAGPAPSRGWQVLVQDLDTDPAERIELAGGWAVATSSAQKRRWQHDGRSVHHILDPRWGIPADPVWRSVTVVAPTCLAANTLSTAAIVRGRGAVPMLRQRGRAARLVAADGTLVRLGGWPEDAEDTGRSTDRAVA
jgi:thiamine biosynthesis lipoprotein